MIGNSQRHLAVSISCLRVKGLILMHYLISVYWLVLPLSTKSAISAQLSWAYPLESCRKLLALNDNLGLLEAVLSRCLPRCKLYVMFLGLFIGGRWVSEHSSTEQLFTPVVDHLSRHIYVDTQFLILLLPFIFTGARRILQFVLVIVHGYILRINWTALRIESTSLEENGVGALLQRKRLFSWVIRVCDWLVVIWFCLKGRMLRSLG